MKYKLSVFSPRALVSVVLLAQGSLTTALAADERSFFDLSTGNGHGFQIFNTRSGRLTAFLDHPYRYLRPGSDITKDGIERRNLMEGFSTTVKLAHPFADSDTIVDSGNAESAYVEETNIIRVPSRPTERFFFSPFGFDGNAMVALVRINDQSLLAGASVTASMRFHLGGNPVSPTFYQPSLEVVKMPGEKIYRLDQFERPLWVEEGQGLGAMVYLPLQADAKGYCDLFGLNQGGLLPADRHGDRSCVADDLGYLLSSAPDQDGYFGAVILYVEDKAHIEAQIRALLKWVDGRSGRLLLEGSLEEWRKWRKAPKVRFRSNDENKLWRQSEAVLRMGQVREPNGIFADRKRVNNGMIMASLAPGHWTTGWVRDGLYGVVALTRAGYLDEAKRALNFFLNAEPVGKFKSYVDNVDYRISVTRYFGSGEEEADYSNQATPNVETDGWGLMLWAARQYLDHSGDFAWLKSPTRKGTVYEALLEGVVKPIESQLEKSGPLTGIMKPDSSIWEVHQQNARHFAYTTLAVARGLCDFASFAKRSGKRADHLKYSKLAERVRAAYLQKFKVKEGNLIAAIERSDATDVDAAVVESYGLDVIKDFSSPLAKNTLAHIEKLKLPSGGFSRSVGDSTYQTNEWAFIDYRMAVAYLRMKQPQKAHDIIDMLTTRSINNFYLLPELYVATASEGPIGSYQGSNPMVGYGAGAFVLAVLDREGRIEDRRCN